MAIYLKITEDNNNHHVRLGARPVFIGRSTKCHISLNDSMVSGRHLAIKVNADNHVVIKDLDTTNGTYLNGNKIDESLLFLDDFIQVGRVKMSLIRNEMTPQEIKTHQRDFERTNVTFVNMDNGLIGDGASNKKRTLLAQIREKNKGKEVPSSRSERKEPTPIRENSSIEDISAIKPKIVFEKDSEEDDSNGPLMDPSLNTPQNIKTSDSSVIIEEDDEDFDNFSEFSSVELKPVPPPITPELKSPSKDSNKDKETSHRIADDLLNDQDDEDHFATEDDDDSEDDDYEYEYVEEEEESSGLVSKLKGLFKR